MMVTIDGPAASGKSTVAKLLAKRLNFIHLNSGQIFRALTAKCLENDLLEKKDVSIESFAKTCEISCTICGDKVMWIVDQSDVTSKLTSQAVVQHVSQVAALGAVRERAKAWQRKWARGKNAVVEGRDAGSAVFRSADAKIYLTAALAVRAKRRWNQLNAAGEQGEVIDLQKIEEDLARRDHIDTARLIDPLACPKGAIYLDTTAMSARAAAAHLYRLVRAQLALV